MEGCEASCTVLEGESVRAKASRRALPSRLPLRVCVLAGASIHGRHPDACFDRPTVVPSPVRKLLVFVDDVTYSNSLNRACGRKT